MRNIVLLSDDSPPLVRRNTTFSCTPKRDSDGGESAHGTPDRDKTDANRRHDGSQSESPRGRPAVTTDPPAGNNPD